jgi:DNA-binding NarL/FixJ family response regulator
VILVDLDIPSESPLRVIQRVVARCPQAAVVALGLSESEEDIVKIAEAGANGYVPRTASFGELLGVAVSARLGGFACTSNFAGVLSSRLAELEKSKELDLFQTAGLTTRESQIMKLVARDLSNKEIGSLLCVSEFTVRNHVHHILTKLRVRNRRLAARLPGVSFLTGYEEIGGGNGQ